MMRLEKSEGNLVELKARADSVGTFRKRLQEMKADHIGTFHQTDTYYEVPEGRLKLRETEGTQKAQIVYYEREDIAGPKTSRVFILELQEPEFFNSFLHKALETKIVVDKTREIYRYQGPQIHLDTVKNLGTFIEFERRTEGTAVATSKDRETLEDLMKTLGINTKDLIEGSYSDLLTQGRK
ncbi:MAG: class IV adenylate cyclase [Candidatus Bathyarchaeota archaeon]|nr:class IV adenylate cyclase [Candidatus Bathyarchaeota archaeon]